MAANSLRPHSLSPTEAFPPVLWDVPDASTHPQASTHRRRPPQPRMGRPGPSAVALALAAAALGLWAGAAFHPPAPARMVLSRSTTTTARAPAAVRLARKSAGPHYWLFGAVSQLVFAENPKAQRMI